MKNLLIVLVVVGIPAIADARAFTMNEKNVTEADRRAPWFNCKAEGNYPDPSTCDCYIACTTALDAYQMPCAMGPNGQRLYYVPTSGPDPAKSYCDYPQNVDCDLEKTTVENTPETTTEIPEVPRKCLPGVKEGEKCNHKVDCQECGYCDWYLRCGSDNVWHKSFCSMKPSPDGTLLVDKKLFWLPGYNDHGGICVPYKLLPKDVQDEYVEDEQCKPECYYREDKTCARKYYYSDPKLADGYWEVPEKVQMCPEETKWDQAALTCTICEDTNKCNDGC